MQETTKKEKISVNQSANEDPQPNGNGDTPAVDAVEHAVGSQGMEFDSEPKKKRRLPFLIAGSVLLAAAVLGSIYWLYTRQFVYTDDAFVYGEIVQISPRISAYVTKVAVKENQFVKKGDLLVELNDDELRARLDFAESELAGARAQQRRAQAQTNLTRVSAYSSQLQARSNVETSKNAIKQIGVTADAKRYSIRQAELAVKTANANREQARSRIEQAESNLRLAQIENDRTADLFKFGTVSRQSLDRAENALQNAKAELNLVRNQATTAESLIEEAEAKVVEAQNSYKESLFQIASKQSESDESFGRLREADSVPEKIAVDQSEIGTADAKILQAESTVREAELALTYTKIYAPEAGFVTRKNVREGQLVQPGTALMALSQTDIWVVANFKETQVEKMRVGQSVDIWVDAFPGRAFHGRVESFQAGTGSAFSVLPPENASGNFVKIVQRVPVKIVFDEKPDDIHLLVPGMSVQPRVKVL